MIHGMLPRDILFIPLIPLNNPKQTLFTTTDSSGMKFELPKRPSQMIVQQTLHLFKYEHTV